MKKTWIGIILLLLSVAAAILQYQPSAASGGYQAALPGADLFQQKCSGCHTIGGGKLVGPDLQGVTARRDQAWLESFITDPGKMIAAGDPAAVQLLAEYNNLPMPALGLSNIEITELITFLGNPNSAAPLAAPSLPAGDPQRGQRIFSGETGLANGGQSCIACHTVGGTGYLGGGSLGPDLTHVLQRYGQPGLEAALGQIAFPTMQGPFLNRPLIPQEQADLVAFFAWSDTQAPAPAPASTLSLVMLAAGVIGALLLFGGMAVFWPRQRESQAARLRKNPAGWKRLPTTPGGSPR